MIFKEWNALSESLITAGILYSVHSINQTLRSNEALLGRGGGGGVSNPLSLKFRWLIPKITETVIPKITYLLNFTIDANFNV